MKRIRNVLFSTTRQWNPGDEFILMGVLNLMRSLIDFNPIIFNRNPEIQRKRSKSCFNLSFDLGRCRVKLLKPGFYDNSFKEKFLDEPFINLAVFAGTPEWASMKLKGMYEYVHRNRIPCVYLGIGAGDLFDFSDLSVMYRRVLERAKLIIVRDNVCRRMLGHLKPVLLPCPSLLAAPKEYERDIGKVMSIGLVFSSSTSAKFNRISKETYLFQMNLYRRLLEAYAGRLHIEFICHYIDELPAFYREFPSLKCNYSYDSRDYLDIYNKFDMVIGARVHGIGLAASMGIPGIHIDHDIRGDTCNGFQAARLKPGCSLDEAMGVCAERIAAAASLHANLLEHKNKVFLDYESLLRKALIGMVPDGTEGVTSGAENAYNRVHHGSGK